ncbi:hypothetical protein GT042_34880, partial [Streptomyces sp. SID3212]|nr:hypothetical protein [Streptomyces sp. SID3212]
MRQRALRLSLLAGGIIVAFFVLLAVYGGDRAKEGRTEEGRTEAKAAQGNEKPGASAPLARLTVPPAYDPAHGWEITGASPTYALAGAGTATRLAHLERAGDNRFRLRTLDPATGQRRWD